MRATHFHRANPSLRWRKSCACLLPPSRVCGTGPIAVCASSTVLSGAAALAAGLGGPSTVMTWCTTIETFGSGPISVLQLQLQPAGDDHDLAGLVALANATPTRP